MALHEYMSETLACDTRGCGAEIVAERLSLRAHEAVRQELIEEADEDSWHWSQDEPDGPHFCPKCRKLREKQ